jgi:alpha-beta hydrolase superfamily lysophospholipase
LLWATVPLAVVLLSFARGVRTGYRNMHPPRERLRPQDVARARAVAPDLREVALTTADGLRLRGWFLPPRNGVAIVYVPGLGANRMALFPEAELLFQRGYGALLFDPRAHGESEGELATWGAREADDTRRAIAFTRAQPGVQHVVVLGFSVGASAACLASSGNDAVDAVILYATWSSLEDEIAYKRPRPELTAGWATRWTYAWYGVDVSDVRPLDRIAGIAPRPLLMVAGDHDGDTPLYVMKRVYEAAREPKRLWIVEGLDHGHHVRHGRDAYAAHVGGFLDDVFKR